MGYLFQYVPTSAAMTAYSTMTLIDQVQLAATSTKTSGALCPSIRKQRMDFLSIDAHCKGTEKVATRRLLLREQALVPGQ